MLAILLLTGANRLTAQSRQCGTTEVLEQAYKSNPSLRSKFDKQTTAFQQSVHKRIADEAFSGVMRDTVYIPVVFHIVLNNPATITDAQVRAQLSVLNNDFAGKNKDSLNIIPAFKPLFGKSIIQFVLAQRTPTDEPTNGITRTVATTPIYGTFDKSLKYAAQGGADAWDSKRYLNVWVTNLVNGLVLGYATLPGTAIAEEDGVVIHYGTLPADSITKFNLGRTLTHETGHFFYLYHIWGDARNCTGTDYVDDTPNQSWITDGCPGGAIYKDDCNPNEPGRLYQDYMDYTDDACMALFTHGQVTRMETALSDFRSGYYTSNGGDPIVDPNLREKGFLVTPNPAKDVVKVQFYPLPTTLKSIALYNASGQKLAQQLVNGGNAYSFNIGRYASGVYIVQVRLADKTITRKVLKL